VDDHVADGTLKGVLTLTDHYHSLVHASPPSMALPYFPVHPTVSTDTAIDAAEMYDWRMSIVQ
jgi:hypothetical protein